MSDGIPGDGVSRDTSIAVHDAVDTECSELWQLNDAACAEQSGFYDIIMEKAEYALLDWAYRVCGGNKSAMARLLTINRGTLRSKLKKYNLE